MSEKRGSKPRVVEATARQLECLAWVAEGKTAAEIGIILDISPRTVQTHLARACGAFGVHKTVQAVVKAQERDMLPDVRR